MKTLITISLALGLCVQALHAIAIGDDVTLGNPATRQAALESAIKGEGFSGPGNATAATLNADTNFMTFGTWMQLDEVTAAQTPTGSNSIFKVVLTSGDWGDKEVAGTWEILDLNFWSKYAYGAISMHVGSGTHDPDHFVWRLSPNLLDGTWIYDGTAASTGGGLSNLKLYKAGTASLPDGGTTVLLLGSAFAALALISRRIRTLPDNPKH